MDGSKRGKVSNRRRANAIQVRADAAENPGAPLYLRTQAARALLSAARREDKAEDDQDTTPQANLILPDNGRSAERPANWYPDRASVDQAIAEGKSGTFIVGSPEADAARIAFVARLQRRANASRIAALPAPDTI